MGGGGLGDQTERTETITLFCSHNGIALPQGNQEG